MVLLLLNDNFKKYEKLTKNKNVFSKNRKVFWKTCFYASFEILITWIDRSRCVDSIGDIHFIWIYRDKSKIKVKVIKNWHQSQEKLFGITTKMMKPIRFGKFRQILMSHDFLEIEKMCAYKLSAHTDIILVIWWWWW